MKDEISCFYDDDGTKINPELISNPGLCVTCKKNDAGGMEEILCTLTRSDQRGEKDFECDAYEPKYTINDYQCNIPSSLHSLSSIAVSNGNSVSG